VQKGEKIGGFKGEMRGIQTEGGRITSKVKFIVDLCDARDGLMGSRKSTGGKVHSSQKREIKVK